MDLLQGYSNGDDFDCVDTSNLTLAIPTQL